MATGAPDFNKSITVTISVDDIASWPMVHGYTVGDHNVVSVDTTGTTWYHSYGCYRELLIIPVGDDITVETIGDEAFMFYIPDKTIFRMKVGPAVSQLTIKAVNTSATVYLIYLQDKGCIGV